MASELATARDLKRLSTISKQTSSACRKPKCRKDNSTSNSQVTKYIGTMPKRKAIQERLSSPSTTPISVAYGIGIDEHDHEGRVITLEMERFYLVNVYTPNSQDELRRLDYRMTWEEDFRKYLLALDEKKPVIVCGDMNVAHKEIDLKNPKTNRRNAGFTDEERDKFTVLLDSGFIDTFRFFYPEQKDAYSWWSYRFKAREKNAGWRIDYFLVSSRLAEQLKGASIHNEIYGSDHCPVELVIE